MLSISGLTTYFYVNVANLHFAARYKLLSKTYTNLNISNVLTSYFIVTEMAITLKL